MATKPSNGPECIRCGGTLELPNGDEGQYECDSCDAVVARDMVRQKQGRRSWS